MLSYTYYVDTLIPGHTDLGGLGPEIDTDDTHGGRGFSFGCEAGKFQEGG